VDNNDIAEQLKEEHIQAQYIECWSDIDIWEQEEMENIRRTANLMRQEIVDVVGERLYRPKQELSLLTNEINSVREAMKPFDEIDLNQWEYLLDRVKKLAKFTVTLRNVDDGLVLTLSGRNLEDASLENTDRRLIGLIPITSPRLQSTNHIQSATQTDTTTQTSFSSINNMQSDQTQRLEASANDGMINRIARTETQNNQRPTTRLARPRAAEIPFEHRNFYPLRWRVNP